MSASNTPNNARFFGAAKQAQNDNLDLFQAGGSIGLGAANDTGSTRRQVREAETFFHSVAARDIGLNWDKLYPFQFLTLRKNGNSYKIEDRFTLPIPPQSLSISTPFAISMAITQGGVLEEHNGAPLRIISLQGTTGVFPLRGTAAKPGLLEANLTTIFAGTVTGARQVATAISQAGNLIGRGTPPVNIVSDADLEKDNALKGTGFYQFLLLKRFLEAYAAAKKAGDKDLRLGFAIWKEKEIYLVTPASFDVSRSGSSPLAYPFSISMRAWRRISIEETTGAQGPYTGHVGAREPNKLAQVNNLLESGQRILEGSRNALQGVRADIQQVLFTPLRQTLLLVKDAVGVVLTAVDLPTDIISDFREPLLEAAALPSTVSNSLSRIGPAGSGRRDQSASTSAALSDAAKVEAMFRSLSISSGKADTGAGRPSIRDNKGNFFAGPPGPGGAAPANKVSANPSKNFEFFATIRPSDLSLRPDTIRKIEAERNSVKLLKRKDFEIFRDNTLRVLADFADFVGAGNATFTSTFGLPQRTSNRTPTDSEWETMNALSQIAQQYDTMAASAQIDRDPINSMEYVAGLAARSGIAFRTARSKFAVPFPYGYTLEKLSAKYLGTPDRWMEIATLNGLRAPYVDETGFKLGLLTNGNGNQVIVNSIDNLYVGQQVWMSSNSVRRETRRIQQILQLSASQYAVLLDGAADLGRFTTVAGAFLEAFLPGTVNSQQQIYIPSSASPSEEDFLVKSIPGVDYFDPLVRSGGIDLLLTPDGDLVITPDGDGRLAVGLTNLIQKARLAIGTPRGALLHHPDYGIGLLPGTSTADLTASQVLTDLQQLFKGDSGYLGVQSAGVLKKGNSLQVRVSIGIAGTGQYVPVSVEIKR
jgi:hypothetical protein